MLLPPLLLLRQGCLLFGKKSHRVNHSIGLAVVLMTLNVAFRCLLYESWFLWLLAHLRVVLKSSLQTGALYLFWYRRGQTAKLVSAVPLLRTASCLR